LKQKYKIDEMLDEKSDSIEEVSDLAFKELRPN
jgi:hypothetical protein